MFKLGNDFLTNAQRVDPLQMELDHNPIIDSMETKFVSFGSCFAQNMQREMKHFNFDFHFNRNICAYYTTTPLVEMLDWIEKEIPHTEDDLHFFDDKREEVSSYRYFRVKNYGKNAKEKTLEEMKRLDEELRLKIIQANIFIITLGTATNTKLKRNGKAVCTFFGIPTENASIDMIYPEEVTSDLTKIYQSIKNIRDNKDFHLFLTVSPQRYNWNKSLTGRPPVIQNNLSKSILRVGVEQFIEKHKSEFIHYFPAFEMVIDELRLHESLSIYDHLHIDDRYTPKYVVKRFLNQYCSEDVKKLLILSEDINNAKVLTKEIMTNGGAISSNIIKQAWKEISLEISGISKRTSCLILIKRINDFLNDFNDYKYEDLIKDA